MLQMELPEVIVTLQTNKEVTTAVSSWHSLQSQGMQENGYIKIIAIYYDPEEAHRNITQVVPATRKYIKVSREFNIFSNYIRPSLSTIIVDPSWAAQAANILNSQQKRLVQVNITGWVDYHQLYENAIRFQQWGRLTPRRVNQPVIMTIENNDRAIQEAPIMLAIDAEQDRAIEAPQLYYHQNGKKGPLKKPLTVMNH